MKAWLNGELIDENKAALSIFDRSYLYGEGVFETVRCYRGKPAFLDRHYKRFEKNCRTLEIPLTLSEHELRGVIDGLLKGNRLQEATLRMTLSLVGASFGVDRPKNASTNISLFCREATLDPKLFEKGVKVFPSRFLINDSVQTAGIKSTSYLTKMLARAEASKNGAYETLLKNSKGFWVEGSRTNLFIILDHVVITAPLSDGILNGITREVVLEMLQEKNGAHREDHITDLMLQNADEIFLTGSTTEVMPVCEVLGIWKKEPTKEATVFKIQKEYKQRLPA